MRPCWKVSLGSTCADNFSCCAWVRVLQTYVILCLTAAAAGAINAVAGGGTLLTFPVLFSALGPQAAVLANGTSTVALFPGALAALGGYRRELEGTGRWTAIMAVPSLLGAVIGSLLAVLFPAYFRALVPWLILTAALLFALQPQIARWTGIGRPHQPAARFAALGTIAFQFLVAVYGGYFGAGIGILMLCALAMMGMTDIHRMNGVKSALGSLINGVAALMFIVTGHVDWRYALPMAVAATIGGYAGAHWARRLDRQFVRAIVIAIGFSLAGYYFYRELAA